MLVSSPFFFSAQLSVVLNLDIVSFTFSSITTCARNINKKKANQKVIATTSCQYRLCLWHPQGYALSPILFVLNLALKTNAITGTQMISN